MQKKLRSRIVSILMIMAVITPIFSPITAKADTETDDTGIIYVNINSQTDLSLMSVPDPRNYYILTEDIVISGDWQPISNFTGTFDGGGHTITFNIEKALLIKNKFEAKAILNKVQKLEVGQIELIKYDEGETNNEQS